MNSMKFIFLLAFLNFFNLVSSFNPFFWKKKNYPDLPVVKLDIQKMMGRWYF